MYDTLAVTTGGHTSSAAATSNETQQYSNVVGVSSGRGRAPPTSGSNAIQPHTESITTSRNEAYGSLENLADDQDHDYANDFTCSYVDMYVHDT